MGAMSQVLALLTPQQEAFAKAYVELDNASAAYRRVYASENCKRETIWSNAAREIAHPDVARRIRELRDAAAAGSVVRAVDLIRDWYDIATADPNEIVRAVTRCCRYCYGMDHRYQWRDDAEYAAAYAVSDAQHKRWEQQRSPVIPEPPIADASGGVGYDHQREPVMSCPECYGAGVAYVILQDTAKLSPAARKLYKSAKQDRYGAVEVLMHDQEAAREKLGRVLGAFKDGAGLGAVPLPEAAVIDPAASDEAAARGYLTMVGK